MLRGDSYYKRNLLAVPSYRHYFRNNRILRTRRSATTDSGWQPSCKFFVGSFCTVLLITFMIYMKSMASKYTHHWTWKLSNDHNTKHFNSMQKALEHWLSKYPQIEAHRAHIGFTCDPWQCKPTYNIGSNQWIEPRKEYKMLLPDNKRYYEWKDRHKKQNDKLIESKQQCQWIFIGNSISSSWQFEQNQDIFNKYFNQNNAAIIYAQSGDRIHEIGWRLNEDQGNGFKNMEKCLLNGNNKKQQKSIILLIGTNDIGSGSSYNVALKDYMILLHEMVSFVDKMNKHQNVVLYIMGIFPRGQTYTSYAERIKSNDKTIMSEDWNIDNKYFYSINFMNDYLKLFADNDINKNIKYINCNDYFLSDKNIIEFKDADNKIHEYKTGSMDISIFEDMLHLTPYGYEKWSKCILQQIN